MSRKYIVIIAYFSIFLSCQNQRDNIDTEADTTSKNEKAQLDSNNETSSVNPLPEVAKTMKFENIEKRDGACEYEINMANEGLVNIVELDSSIGVSLKYSTTDNFVGKDVYGCLSTCYLQEKAAKMLANASKILQSEHDSLRLLVYDGARPHQIQQVLWESLPQYPPKIRQNYVADPANGSIHNYGSAVDLTLCNNAGVPLDMGTKYDFFGELAYPKLEQKLLREGKLSQKQIDNRKILRNAMTKAGFSPIEYEWWHFNAVSRNRAKMMYKIIK